MAELILHLHALQKRFGGVQAVQPIHLTVESGERRGVIGPNGAGKSTLFRMISGEVRPSGGDVFFRKRRITGFPPEGTARLGLARTFQHSSLFPQLTVLENVALAAIRNGRGRWNMLRPLHGYPAVVRDAERALDAVGLAGKSTEEVSSLSHGERRQLEIAMALAQRPVLLLLDEPIAGLAGAERTRVEELLRGLPREITLMLIEHDLEFAFSLADRVTVLHYGQVVAEGTPDEVRRSAKAREVYIGAVDAGPSPTSSTGWPVSSPPGVPDGQSAPIPPDVEPTRVGADVRSTSVAVDAQPMSVDGEVLPTSVPHGESGGLRSDSPVIDVNDLHVGYGDALVLHGVTLRVRKGELVALLGRNGMGKTTTLHSLAGFLRPMRGSIRLNGRDATGHSPLEMARADVALVPQGRRMFPDMTVDEQLAIASRPGPWTMERVMDVFPALRERGHVVATNLSGGEQQMVAIARALMRNPRVLLFDEPSEGLSPALVKVISDVIAALRDQGETMVLAEQNVPMALAIADRVYILERGRVVYEGTPGELRSRQDVLRKTLGV